MPRIDDMIPSGPVQEDRLVWERQARQYIQRIFTAAMSDRWDSVYSIYKEAQRHGEWMAVALWCGIPNTLKQRIQEYEHDARRTDTRESSRDTDVVSHDRS